MKTDFILYQIPDYGPLKLEYRVDTWDKNMIHENLGRRVYLNKIGPRLKSTDVWLDVGAHIGSFALSIASKVKSVICYEPSNESFRILARNIALNVGGVTGKGFVYLKNCAVGRDTLVHVPFYLNTEKNPGTNSFFVKRGRKLCHVDQDSLLFALNHYNVNKIKLDCEGSEAEIVDALMVIPRPKIKELIAEFHANMPSANGARRYNLFIKQLKSIFRVVDYKPLKKSWTVMVHAYN